MLLDGKVISTKIKDMVKEEVKKIDDSPCLAVIQVGDNQASSVYVGNKIKACDYTGIKSISISIDNDKSPEEIENDLLILIDNLNNNNTVNGILVQLPLPKGINVETIINAIDPKKDVDCFHPYNIGQLYNKNTIFKPCTPAGIIEICKHYNIDLDGKHCVIIGRSDIVGKPMSQLLLHENATVTICHSRTKNLSEITRVADVIISAVGKAGFVTKEMVSENTVIIDVGMNRNTEGKLCGDVNFSEVVENVDNISITPVPGGVGLTTVAMLMVNTLNAYKLQNNLL